MSGKGEYKEMKEMYRKIVTKRCLLSMVEKLSRGRKIITAVIALAVVVIGAALVFIVMLPEQEPQVPVVGHIHMTGAGGFRDTMSDFIAGQFEVPVEFEATGSRYLRDYLTIALARGSIERGTLFSYNHRQVHRQFEAARPFIAEFPDLFPVRAELAELADPRGELHLVWVDAYVIIYNPDLIAREEVPSTLVELAEFDQPISVVTTGCLGTWGTMAFYHHLGEEAFRRLIGNAEVTGSLGDVTKAVREGTVAVGISSLLNVMVRDGDVGVIWPRDGAIAKPAYLVIPDNPTDYHLRLAQIIMSPVAAELFAREFNMASALPDGPVPAIVEENNFNFVFIPTQAIICEETAARVDQIVGS